MIIVTGANGFIGSAIIWELSQREPRNVNRGLAKIVAVDSVSLSERADLLAKANPYRFLHSDELWKFLEQPEALKIQWVIHMGACSDTTELDVEFLKHNNTEYTQKLWSWCVKNKIPFIYASSGAVYGAGERGFSDEENPELLKPLNPYGDSKLNFDRWVVKQTATPPNWYGLRFFNVFGPNEYHKGHMSSVVFKAFHQIKSTGQMKLFRSHRPDYGDGLQKRDFVYVKDITAWIAELMEKKPASGIYNMGYGTARTWLDLAEATFAALNAPKQIEWIDIPQDMQARYQYFTEAKIDRLLSLGLNKPRWPLKEAVTDYVQNYLMQTDPYL